MGKTVSEIGACVIGPLSIEHLPPTMSMLVSGPSALVVLIVLSVVFGVIYPAVWSRRPARRKAAMEVLKQLLRRR